MATGFQRYIVTYSYRQMVTPMMNNPLSEIYGYNYIYKTDYKLTVSQIFLKKFDVFLII
jgi:uncharacterized protein YqgQ